MTIEPGVTVTLKDIYDEVRKIQTQMAELTPQVKNIVDHETRLRALERWKYAVPGSLLLATSSVAVAVAQVH